MATQKPSRINRVPPDRFIGTSFKEVNTGDILFPRGLDDFVERRVPEDLLKYCRLPIRRVGKEEKRS